MKNIAIISALALAACANSGQEAPDATYEPEAASPTRSPMPALIFYDRREPAEGEVIPPPILTRLTGTLTTSNDCLAIENNDGLVAIAFETGSAEFDEGSESLRVEGETFRIGELISVGGPFTQPTADFAEDAITQRCGADSVWLVVTGDVSKTP